jgi:hypothetical protein
MNIVGENFPSEIVKQISIRQEKKGAKNRDNKNLIWQNANTGWVKMVSSVSINKKDREKVSNREMANILLPGSKLAQQYVLFGGVYQQGENKDGLSRGIARNQSVLNHAAYGLGGLDLGLRPMPGITSFSIKSENRGSLRTATIGIKCYNRQQFDIINTLYLSLGYSVLIEWGNVMYYDNNGRFEEENTHSLADEFLEGSLKWNSILDNIQKERLKSCGNYDASLGKIVNFRWTLNKDLSYDVTVTVRSVGDVIESLKMNALSGYIPVDLSLASQVTTAFLESGTKDFNKFVLDKAVVVKQVYNRLLQNGLDDIKARGVLANVLSESRFKPDAYNPNDNGGPSGGLFQWHDDPRLGYTRLTRMIRAVGPDWRTNIQGQVDYVFKESGTRINEFKNQTFPTAGDAAYWWARYWEVTARAHWETRRANAQLFPPGLNFSANTAVATNTQSQPQLLNSLNSSLPNNNTINTGTGTYTVVPLKNPIPQTPPTTTQSSTGTTPPVDTTQSPTDATQSTALPTEATSVKIISKYAYTHDIGALFYNMMIKLNSNPTPITNGSNIDAVKISFDNNGATTDQYYVRLGYFLQQIEKNIIYQLKNSDEKNPSKIIKFDYDIDSNIILLYSRQLSANPNACIFKRKFILSDGTDVTLFPELNDFLLEGSGSTYSSFYGKIMNSYFSMSYILDQMNRLKNADTGVLALIDLLKILTTCFCSSTGNYNSIEPTVDYETNTIKFIDDVKLPDFSAIISKLPNQSNITARFDMFGYYATPNPNVSTAGIVRDLSLTTTVSPNLATMLTIGAQSNGYVTGQDATSLSVMNYGLKDRVKEEWIEPTNPNAYPSPPSTPVFVAPLLPPTTTPIQTSVGVLQNQTPTTTPFINIVTNRTQPTPQTQPAPSGAPTLEVKYKDVIESFNRFIQEISQNVWNQEDITAFNNSIQSFAEYNQAQETLKQRQENPLTSSPNIGFLPFDLTLTIDGLSGMKIYQKFVADTEFLPSNYPQSLEFLIKGITHEIKDNQWVTTLESLAVPKNPFGTKDKFNVGSKINGQSSITERAAGAGGSRSSGFTAGGSSSTACGTTVVQNLNAPIITQGKINAFQASFKAVFANGNGPGGRCGRWTYNLAYNYSQALKGKPLSKGAQLAAGGNANDPGYRANLKRLGYQEILWGKNVPKSKLVELLSNNSGIFSPGDVIIYYSNDGAKFHTQMYTGGYGVSGYNWTTDNKTNFGVSFVYNSKPQNCYTLYLFRAPSDAASSTISYGSTTPSTNAAAGNNVTIGDSISVGVDGAYTNIKGISSPVLLNKVGQTASGLLGQLQKVTTPYTNVKNLVLSIGSNNGWNLSNPTDAYLAIEIKRVFPNATLYILNGNYGWGSLTGNTDWPSKINNYINFYKSKGFNVIGKVSKVTVHPKNGDALFNSFIQQLSRL